ncbi:MULTISPECIES: DUF429 domain-containing protein [unclassified Pedobacter]|uniref:DUF429 domain-containing protein n=1 Tax=unclassified Pedobacter TaxID=2628915 RepID=UPI00224849B7|nr:MULTISPECIES: DUF429 domain-containing protein [unclassified Pedobacter]MCX2430485.1 DUF429 domain-containing protein [Pedobacter sp. GR22-10]MCX2585300.1 DUF429 domain-containing protein [Pedobacter sp. MR22-3]
MSNHAVGVDGCKFGWVAASYAEETIKCFSNITEVWSYFGKYGDFLIDMPLGLPSAKNPHRTCEQEARAILPKERKSSLFPVPCREAFAAESYSEANEINKNILGKGLSKQSWFIMPKMKEVDDLLTGNHAARVRFKEAHPEVSFQLLNQGKPLRAGKKTTAGIAERLAILQQWDSRTENLYQSAIQLFTKKALAPDDILDALCLSAMQSVIQQNEKSGQLHTFPEKPFKDACGIKMAIHYGVLM